MLDFLSEQNQGGRGHNRERLGVGRCSYSRTSQLSSGESSEGVGLIATQIATQRQGTALDEEGMEARQSLEIPNEVASPDTARDRLGRLK